MKYKIWIFIQAEKENIDPEKRNTNKLRSFLFFFFIDPVKIMF